MIAFELARTPGGLALLFGERASTCQADFIAGMNTANWGDLLLYMPLYGAFLVVFFAGHGFTEDDRGYVLPHEAGPDTRSGAISVQQLKETALRTKARHVLYLVDACFSGSMLKRRASGKANDLAFWESLAKERGVEVLTAGAAKEVVFEFDGWGAFTRALHAGLEGGAYADHDGVTTFHADDHK